MSASRFADLPRKKTLTGKPPTREDRVIAELEQRFPGATWLQGDVDDCPTTTPEENGSPSASTSSEMFRYHRDSDALSREGTGTYFIVGGGKYNPQALRKWLVELQSEQVVTTAPRRKKNGEPVACVEAIVLDVVPRATVRELRSDHYGAGAAGELAGADLAADALAAAGTLVLVGSGGRVTRARAVVERLGRYAPPLVELP